MVAKGKFVVFDGLDMTGKTTQSKLLVEWLTKNGIVAIHTFEPFDDKVGRFAREIARDPLMDPQTKWLLFSAARQNHLQEAIRPALEKGVWVVCDRFFGSTFAYQGVMEVPSHHLLELHRLLNHHEPKIDKQFIFTGKVKTDQQRKQDAMDAFCDRNRQALTSRFLSYAKWSQSQGIETHIINVYDQQKEALAEEIREHIQKQM